MTACAPDCPLIRPALPPAVYLQEVPEPPFHGQTNGDLLNWSLELRAALRQSNSDKAAMRQWYEEMNR